MSDLEARLRALGGGGVSPPLDAVADRAGVLDVAWDVMGSPVGPLVLAATDQGLLRITFGDEEVTLQELATAVSPRLLRSPVRLDDARRQLDAYFDGGRRTFELNLDLRLASGFRREVLGHLAQVPYGATVSYADLAEAAGRPRAYRAVGTTMATNPIPLVLPCHRVLRTGGGIGGYGGGLDVKRYLLALEGVEPPT